MKNKSFYVAVYSMLFALMISCNQEKPFADKKTDSSIVAINDSLIAIPEPTGTNMEQKEVWERYVSDEGYTHLDPDTSLVLYMYTHYNEFDAQEQYEEYVRWDLEKESIQSLYKELLATKPDADSVLAILNTNGERFLTIMKTDLEQSKQFDSREFQYLLERQDPFVKSFLKMVIKDPVVSEEVKLEARETLEDLAW